MATTPPVPHAREFAGESWDPTQYLKFSDHRLRPALDLIERVPLAAPSRIYDLGCGSGHITRMLADRWPDAIVVGMDNSPQMLAKARATPSSVHWEQGDLADWQPSETPSLLFSNAAIQWLPDHRTLIPRLWSLLPAGGCLAVQAPLSWDQPSHRLMRETLADSGAGGAALGSAELRQAVDNRWLHDPAFYYDLLAADAAHIEVWTSEYLQALSGPDPVLEWVTATSLRPILTGLDDPDRATFLDQYRKRLRRAYPQRADGITLYPFLRLFFVAVHG
jgi:trans-aconitate 2-methyltransferase